jgi:hypothetical protein
MRTFFFFILLAIFHWASADCAQTASNATLGITNLPRTTGASATIISKEFSDSSTGIPNRYRRVMNIIAYTDFHVISYVCPGITEGHSCTARILSETSCGIALDSTFTVKLEHEYNKDSVDVAIISIRNIRVPRQNLFSCIESFSDEPISTYNPAVGAPLLRVGYGNKHKSLRRGHFVGFVDINPMFKHAPLPPGQGAGQVPMTKAVSTIPIASGDCGGPVVEESTCKLVATSQLGPTDGKSFDIPALLFDRLALGQKIDHLEATKILREEDWNTVVSRQ